VDELLLSVCLITYNHADYIRDAIDGVLKQKVNFDWELIIADDNSTDGTREIILEYKRLHPNFIHLILQEKNVGAAQNWLDLISTPKSKYIAYFEGDDYWIDPNKLQKQVDFLQANPDYGLVFTDADHFYEKTGKTIKAYDKTFKRKIPTGEVFEELLFLNPYKSCTSVFRNTLVRKNYDLILKKHFRLGDKMFWLVLSSESKVGYLNNSTALYRLRDESASHFGDFKKQLKFSKNDYKRTILLSSIYNHNIDKKKLKLAFNKRIISICMDNGHYKELINYCSNPFLIIRIAIKEKILRKIIYLFR